MKRERLRIAIIGAGRVGTTLGYLLKRCGYRIDLVINRSKVHAKKAVRFIGGGIPATQPAALDATCNLVLITTPDSSIKQVAKQVSTVKRDWHRSVVFHCSGYVPSSALSPLRKLGAAIGSMHPLQTFANPRRAIKILQGSFFSLEGDPRAIKLGKRLVRELGGHPIVIKPASKGLYHCAATMACGHLAALISLANSMMRKSGANKTVAKRLLLPLINGTIENLSEMSIAQALTGPVVRGDVEVVRHHLKEAARYSRQAAMIYKLLGLQTLDSALARKPLRRKDKVLRDLLSR